MTHTMLTHTEMMLVKPEPQAQKYLKGRPMSKLSIVAIVLLSICVLISAIGSLWDPHLLASLPLYLVLLLLNGASLFFSRFTLNRVGNYWTQLETRRQAAAGGDPRLLAKEQPEASATALALPITIEQRPRLSTFLLLPGLILLSVLLGGLLGTGLFMHFVPLSRSGSWPGLFVIIMIGIIGLLALFFAALCAFFMYYRVRQQITLTQDGLLQVGLFSKVRSIPWRDARLFAILGIYGAKTYPLPTQFELASHEEIIRWGWMHENSRKVLYFAKSKVSPEEYQRQMQGVLSVIAAKTGLPLYDLRQETPAE